MTNHNNNCDKFALLTFIKSSYDVTQALIHIQLSMLGMMAVFALMVYFKFMDPNNMIFQIAFVAFMALIHISFFRCFKPLRDLKKKHKLISEAIESQMEKTKEKINDVSAAFRKTKQGQENSCMGVSFPRDYDAAASADGDKDNGHDGN